MGDGKHIRDFMFLSRTKVLVCEIENCCTLRSRLEYFHPIVHCNLGKNLSFHLKQPKSTSDYWWTRLETDPLFLRFKLGFTLNNQSKIQSKIYWGGGRQELFQSKAVDCGAETKMPLIIPMVNIHNAHVSKQSSVDKACRRRSQHKWLESVEESTTFLEGHTILRTSCWQVGSHFQRPEVLANVRHRRYIDDF